MNAFNHFQTHVAGIIVLVLLTLGSAACKKPTEQIPMVVNNNDTSTLRRSYLALGDSYTIGEAVPEAGRFPVQTSLKLAAMGLVFDPPKIIAVTGWTTGNLLSALSQTPPSNTYDIVTLLIGVNNQYQGRSEQEYRTEFTALLNKSINYAGGRKNRVFVLSIPDYSVTPFAKNSDTVRIAKEIDEFNAINKQITQEAGVAYLDITPISREGKSNPGLIAQDGLHPSAQQYERWSSLLAPLIKSSLQ
jgi:lysophospholipase L1-like esterase